ncbi:hypothetical protein FP828_09145 [bacterium]|nr:hypothetical protein [bacterium]
MTSFCQKSFSICRACAALLFFVFVCAGASYAASSSSVFPPEITSDMEFSGKVELQGDCIIREGARVRILPGTEIIPGEEKFSLKYQQRIGKRNIDTAITGKPVIIVEGVLEAEYGKGLTTAIGKLDDKGGPAGIRWGGIVVSQRGRVSLKGVKISDAVYGILACGSSEVLLDNVDIVNCGIGLISANDAAVKIINSKISACATSGIELYENSSVRAEKSMIFSNRQSGVMARHRSRVTLSGCEITQNSKGLYIKDAASADLKENLFHANGMDIDSLKKYETKPLPAGKEGALWRGLVEIKEDFLVPFGSTLRIEEGTKIFVSSSSARDLDFYADTPTGKRKITSDGLCDIIIEGNIVVEGSENKPVIFAAPGPFGSVIMSGRGASSSLANLIFTGRGTGFFITDENAAKFKNAVFEDFFAACVISDAARPSFKDCRFSNCRYAVLIYDSARPFFTDCAFTSCGVSAGMRGAAAPFFRNCTFEKNETALTAAGTARPDCAASSVRENINGFVFFEKSSGEISGNTFVKNAFAIRLKGASFAEINKNAFLKNGSAVLMDASSSIKETGNSFIKNESDCEYAVTASPTLGGVISENEVWGGAIELSGDLLIKEGARLRIKSGTKITVKPSEKDFVFFRDISGVRSEMTRTGLVDIIVEGAIETGIAPDRAKGEGILITGAVPGTAWGGFMFVKNGEGYFRGMSVKNADAAFALFDKSAAALNNCLLENCREGAALYGESVMEIKNCRLTGSEKAVSATMGGVCDISLSVISGNNCGINVAGGGVSAENNLISKNDIGAKITSGSAVFKSNSFLANAVAIKTRVAFLNENNKFYENGDDISENGSSVSAKRKSEK